MTNLKKLEYIHVTLQEQINDCNINNDYYLDDSVDTLLDAFYYLTVTFSRKLRGKIYCEVVTYWGEVFRSEGETHLLAGCRGIYKALKHIGGRVQVDYYQRYL